MDSRKWVKDRTILRVVAGSYSYGTNLPTSDQDYKAICVAPKIYYLAFSKHFEQQEEYVSRGSDKDETNYELRKFMNLASQCNPNCLEALFVDPNDILEITKHGQKLIDNRDLFLSKKARFTYSGYAHQQLNRLKSHRAHLFNPPSAPPDRKDFGLGDDRKLSKDDYGAIESLIDKGNNFSGDLMDLISKERKYREAQKTWDSYCRWKETRNPERSKLEEKFQMDTKHASHLYRLLVMCEEILSGKGLIVKRPDYKDILAIRNGAWTYEQLIEWADKQEEKCKTLYETSTLPKTVDLEKLDNLCMEIIESML